MAFAIPSPFVWDQSFDVKNKALNAEHVRLFQLIDALDKNRDSAAALKELLDLVVAHFKHEENLFNEKHYSDAVAHKATHDKLLTDVAAVKSIGDGEIAFLKNWLVNHIKGSDQKYSDALHD